MLKLFRGIRQKIINENPTSDKWGAGKFSKYLLYAFGEIILVVIGILIALQINIKNEAKRIEIKKTILQTILSDLEFNKETIEKGLDDYNLKIELTQKMANYFVYKDFETDPVTRDSIIFWSSNYTNLELINTSIISLVSSERLELLQNEKLKQEIVKYPTYIELYEEISNVVRSIVLNDIRIDIIKYISLQKYFDIPESFESDYAGLFKDRQLSNHNLNKLSQTYDALMRLENLNVANNSLIDAINMETEERFW